MGGEVVSPVFSHVLDFGLLMFLILVRCYVTGLSHRTTAAVVLRGLGFPQGNAMLVGIRFRTLIESFSASKG